MHQCVDTSSWRRQHHRPGAVPTGLESSSHLQSPTSPWDKEVGRVSTGSIFDSIRDARSMERVSCGIQPVPLQIATSQCVLQIPSTNMATLASATSLESLSLLDLRRASVCRSSQSSTLDALATAMEEEVGIGIPSSASRDSSASPCVPAVVMMCIRHLEQFGLHTVGIFRVSSSKRRVKQVKQHQACFSC